MKSVYDNIDHVTYIFYRKNGCQNCDNAFDPFKKMARKLRGIIRTYELNCDVWNEQEDVENLEVNVPFCRKTEIYDNLP